MVFSSLLFLFRFLPAVLLVYYIVPRRLRNFVLLLFSLGFYAWGEPIYIILMLASILISYTSGVLIDRFKQAEKMQAARITLIVACVASLSLLAFFKYAGFVVETVNSLTGMSISMLHIALPIGISFYTFQTLSYTIDVYRGEAAVQKNLISFGTYVTMFPQLIAGPIVQYKTIDAQLRTRRETTEQFAGGIHRFMIGLGKKVLIANNVGALWNTIQAFAYSEVPVLTAWIGLAAYTFQIYFDFSAYSDMAIGLGHMFGFRFLENFNYPYISKSITEFWRRWHISLSTWFREYVYIPMGGNRVNKWRHIRNILVVWLLTGIWHGASWNFLIWGVYYGVLLLAEKFIIGKYLKKVPALFQHIYCMFFVMLGWHLFVFDHMAQGIEFLKSLFGLYGQGLLNRETVYLLYNNAVLLILCILGCTRLPQNIGKWISVKLAEKEILLAVVRNIFYVGVFLLSVAWLVDATFNPFLYFRF
ncbi:MBOAT family O-acyltransferase [Frisingicoccus sp.]|uniref:MBOAT family O-acyltransferase n=1 Tax=Frisingicoccus sp. TaxID=1918627 RepID=UPI00399A638B